MADRHSRTTGIEHRQASRMQAWFVHCGYAVRVSESPAR